MTDYLPLLPFFLTYRNEGTFACRVAARQVIYASKACERFANQLAMGCRKPA